jgi:hypothetical protein
VDSGNVGSRDRRRAIPSTLSQPAISPVARARLSGGEAGLAGVPVRAAGEMPGDRGDSRETVSEDEVPRRDPLVFLRDYVTDWLPQSVAARPVLTPGGTATHVGVKPPAFARPRERPSALGPKCRPTARGDRRCCAVDHRRSFRSSLTCAAQHRRSLLGLGPRLRVPRPPLPFIGRCSFPFWSLLGIHRRFSGRAPLGECHSRSRFPAEESRTETLPSEKVL